MYINHSGTWKKPIAYINHSGTWKQPKEIWVNHSGVWKKTYTALPTTLGESYGGGYYIGTILVGSITYYLIVSPGGSLENGFLPSPCRWKTTLSDSPGTSDYRDGYTNTYNMNNTTHPAAYYCTGLTIGGYNDWYLPAIEELQLMYNNRSYMPNVPPQGCWSSTQDTNPLEAFALYFSNGVTEDLSKVWQYISVRAIRRVF